MPADQPEAWTAPLSGEHDAVAFLSQHWSDLAPVLRRRVRGFVRRPEDADDAVSDAAVRFVEHARAGKDIASPAALLRKMAVNRAIDVLRSSDGRAIAGHALVAEVMDRRGSEPSTTTFEDDEALEPVRVALRALSPRYREALILSVVRGVPPRHLATQLGVSARSVSSLVYRAKAALREELVVALKERGGGECARYARVAGSEARRHVASCDHCGPIDRAEGTGRWAFVALPGALAMAPFLTARVDDAVASWRAFTNSTAGLGTAAAAVVVAIFGVSTPLIVEQISNQSLYVSDDAEVLDPASITATGPDQHVAVLSQEAPPDIRIDPVVVSSPALGGTPTNGSASSITTTPAAPVEAPAPTSPTADSLSLVYADSQGPNAEGVTAVRDERGDSRPSASPYASYVYFADPQDERTAAMMFEGDAPDDMDLTYAQFTDPYQPEVIMFTLEEVRAPTVSTENAPVAGGVVLETPADEPGDLIDLEGDSGSNASVPGSATDEDPQTRPDPAE